MIKIGKVTESTVELRGPNTATVSWSTLRAAAAQEDPELRAAYGAALTAAEAIRRSQVNAEIEAAPALVVRYGQDETTVWWHAWVETESGYRVGRTWRTMTIVAPDEGGTLPHAEDARREAEIIAERIRKIRGASARVECRA